MDDAALLEVLERVYAEVRGVERDLRPEDRLSEDLALDSLAAAQLLNALEDELQLSLVEDDRVAEIRTVADVLELLRPAATS